MRLKYFLYFSIVIWNEPRVTNGNSWVMEQISYRKVARHQSYCYPILVTVIYKHLMDQSMM